MAVLAITFLALYFLILGINTAQLIIEEGKMKKINDAIFFADTVACSCGHIFHLRDEIGFQEGIFNIECPKCQKCATVYANLEVEYSITSNQDFTVAEILATTEQN